MNFTFHCNFSFMEIFIMCPLCIRDKCLLNNVAQTNQTFLLKTLVTFWGLPFLCHVPYFQIWKLLNLGRQNLMKIQNKIWAKMRYKISNTSGCKTLAWVYSTSSVFHHQLVYQPSFQLTFLGKLTSLPHGNRERFKVAVGNFLSKLFSRHIDSLFKMKIVLLMNLKIFVSRWRF